METILDDFQFNNSVNGDNISVIQPNKLSIYGGNTG